MQVKGVMEPHVTPALCRIATRVFKAESWISNTSILQKEGLSSPCFYIISCFSCLMTVNSLISQNIVNYIPIPQWFVLLRKMVLEMRGKWVESMFLLLARACRLISTYPQLLTDDPGITLFFICQSQFVIYTFLYIGCLYNGCHQCIFYAPKSQLQSTGASTVATSMKHPYSVPPPLDLLIY